MWHIVKLGEWFFRATGPTPHKTTLAYLFPNYILGHCDSLKVNSLDGLYNTQISIRQKKGCLRKIHWTNLRMNYVTRSQHGGGQPGDPQSLQVGMLPMKPCDISFWVMASTSFLQPYANTEKQFLVDISRNRVVKSRKIYSVGIPVWLNVNEQFWT